MYSIKFKFNNRYISLSEKNALSLYIEVLNFLYDNNYDFTGEIHKKFLRKVFKKDEVESIINNKTYVFSDFHNIRNSGNYIYRGGNISKILLNIKLMLENFGIDRNTITTKGFSEDNEIVKFNQYTQKETEKEPTTESKTSSINPFGGKPGSSAICVLGDPGAGKSVTTLNALKQDSDHIYKLLIPTDMTSSLLLQFVRGELRLNMLSKMIIAAYKNPDKLYTILIDEFHKPLTIRRVNDELLQAISTKRYSGTRFISSDIAYELMSEELLEFLEEDQFSYHGNIKIPDNFGFIFLSSKPSVVVDNEDLFDRLDILYIREEDRVNIVSVDDIDMSRISENSDKKEFKKLIKELPNSKDSLDDFVDKFNS